MNAPNSFTCLVMTMLGALSGSVAYGESVTFSRITGNVQVEVSGAPVQIRNGDVLKTPIRIVTGADGALHIEQPSSALDIGPDSVIVVPGTTGSSLAEKILQELGRVLYSVKPRKSGSFTVETPYLVSVVKGTTFSVAIADSSAAVTLLEGLVEVSGPGTTDRVVLQPNQRAVRAAGDRNIAVSIVDTTAALNVPRIPTDSMPAATQLADPSDEALGAQTSRVTDDLGQVTAAYVDSRSLANRPDLSRTPVLPMPAPDTDRDNGVDDDGNNGHGDEEDGEDESNPGNGS